MTFTAIQEGYRLREERLSAFPPCITKPPYVQSMTPEPMSKIWNNLTIPNRTPVWQVSSGKKCFRVLKSIDYRSEKGDELFFVENDKLGIFVTGETPEKAVEAFHDQLIHYWQHYNNLGWNKVTGEGKRLKREYDNLLQEISLRK